MLQSCFKNNQFIHLTRVPEFVYSCLEEKHFKEFFLSSNFLPYLSFSDCAYPVGLERGVIPNNAFSASSWYDVDHEPWLSRLYSREGEGGWCARENDAAQYLQVDLGQVHIITGVATQGKYEISEWAIRFRAWVTNYSLSFSDDQTTWTNYVEHGNTPKVKEKEIRDLSWLKS